MKIPDTFHLVENNRLIARNRTGRIMNANFGKLLADVCMLTTWRDLDRKEVARRIEYWFAHCADDIRGLNNEDVYMLTIGELIDWLYPDISKVKRHGIVVFSLIQRMICPLMIQRPRKPMYLNEIFSMDGFRKEKPEQLKMVGLLFEDISCLHIDEQCNTDGLGEKKWGQTFRCVLQSKSFIKNLFDIKAIVYRESNRHIEVFQIANHAGEVPDSSVE